MTDSFMVYVYRNKFAIDGYREEYDYAQVGLHFSSFRLGELTGLMGKSLRESLFVLYYQQYWKHLSLILLIQTLHTLHRLLKK